MGALILPGNYYDWVEKMEALAEASGTEYRLIYLTFQTVKEYYDSSNKDTWHWCNVLFERYCLHKADKIINADYSKYYDDPAIMGGLELSKGDLDLTEYDEDARKTLNLLANGGTVKVYHGLAFDIVIRELLLFMERNQKHPFDYVLEDLKDDFDTFYKIELGFMAAEGSN